MRKLAAAVKPKPASLANYKRMRAPCVLPKLEVEQDRQLGRVAFFRQVQVGVRRMGGAQHAMQSMLECHTMCRLSAG